MAVLSEANRAACFRDFVNEICAARGQFGALTKAEMRAAIDALDDFMNTNAAAINTSIPQPARGVLTAAQKAQMLACIVRYRYVKGA